MLSELRKSRLCRFRVKQQGNKPVSYTHLYRGFSRVGCFPCIMCRHKEIELIAKNDPEMCQRLIQAEKNVGHSFFPSSYIPQRFCKNKQYPYVEEVLEYVKEHTPDMFEPEGGYACMSMFHGLCE